MPPHNSEANHYQESPNRHLYIIEFFLMGGDSIPTRNIYQEIGHCLTPFDSKLPFFWSKNYPSWRETQSILTEIYEYLKYESNAFSALVYVAIILKPSPPP